MDAPTTEKKDLRTACEGIVHDLRHWHDIPRVGLVERAAYVVRGTRALWILGMFLVAVLLFVAILRMRPRAQERALVDCDTWAKVNNLPREAVFCP